jgi:mycothiol synthase
MSSSLPEGFSLRRGRPDDVEPLTQMLVAEEQAVLGDARWSLADTQDWWRGLADHGEQWIVEDVRGAISGVLGIFQRDDLFNAWIAVDPPHFGRGIEPALLEHAEACTRARGGRSLHVDAFCRNTFQRQLLQRSGYAEERRHYMMQIDFDVRPSEPEWPPGMTCETFDRESDARDFYDVINESFTGQWGYRQMPFDDWVHFRVEAPDFDPTIWFIAREGGEAAGALRGDPNRWGCGWIGMVGVRPRWQRRGVGTALIRTAFRAFYDRGERSVGLGVDAENPTDATRLYERLGMRVKTESVTYVKELT